jgi:hypothetical protein
MTVGVHQAGRHQPSGQIQHLSISAAGFFDLSVTTDVSNSIVGDFKRFRPGLGRVSSEDPRRK